MHFTQNNEALALKLCVPTFRLVYSFLDVIFKGNRVFYFVKFLGLMDKGLFMSSLSLFNPLMGKGLPFIIHGVFKIGRTEDYRKN
jgi:hypothetical protein